MAEWQAQSPVWFVRSKALRPPASLSLQILHAMMTGLRFRHAGRDVLVVEDRITRVELTPETLIVHLASRRILALSLSSLPQLANVNAGQRYQWRVSDDGQAVEWSALGFRLSVADLITHTARDLNSG